MTDDFHADLLALWYSEIYEKKSKELRNRASRSAHYYEIDRKSKDEFNTNTLRAQLVVITELFASGSHRVARPDFFEPFWNRNYEVVQEGIISAQAQMLCEELESKRGKRRAVSVISKLNLEIHQPEELRKARRKMEKDQIAARENLYSQQRVEALDFNDLNSLRNSLRDVVAEFGSPGWLLEWKPDFEDKNMNLLVTCYQRLSESLNAESNVDGTEWINSLIQANKNLPGSWAEEELDDLIIDIQNDFESGLTENVLRSLPALDALLDSDYPTVAQRIELAPWAGALLTDILYEQGLRLDNAGINFYFVKSTKLFLSYQFEIPEDDRLSLQEYLGDLISGAAENTFRVMDQEAVDLSGSWNRYVAELNAMQTRSMGRFLAQFMQDGKSIVEQIRPTLNAYQVCLKDLEALIHALEPLKHRTLGIVLLDHMNPALQTWSMNEVGMVEAFNYWHGLAYSGSR